MDGEKDKNNISGSNTANSDLDNSTQVFAEEDNEDSSGLESLKGGSQLHTFDCPVCLQNASFPVQLPCRHIFCFLCVKGVAQRDKRCALCRQPIPQDFLKDPKLLCYDEIKKKSEAIFDEGYQWFYEGRNGWWQYDERTSIEMERRYKKGDKIFELLIAGFLYVIDLESMRQYRRNDSSRRRRVRRDLRSIPDIKGIAGLRYTEDPPLRPTGDGGENAGAGATAGAASGRGGMMVGHAFPADNNTGDDTYLTPPAPNNTPQTPMTPADSQPGSLSGSQEDLSVHLQNIHLHQNTHPIMMHTHHPRAGRMHSPDFTDHRDASDLYASSRDHLSHNYPAGYDKDDQGRDRGDEDYNDDDDDDDDDDDENQRTFNVTHNSENSDDSLPMTYHRTLHEDDILGEITHDSLSEPYDALHEVEDLEESDDVNPAATGSHMSNRMPNTSAKDGGHETHL